MKRVLIFIGLKIGELVCVSLLWYLLCLLGRIIEHMLFPDVPPGPFWLAGLFGLLGIGVPVFALALIFIILDGNWKLAKKLTDK